MSSDTDRYIAFARTAEQEGEYQKADYWYQRALSTNSELSTQAGLGFFYEELTDTARKRNDLEAAAFWCRRSLDIEEAMGNEYQIAGTCGKMGLIEMMRKDFLESGRWIIRSATIYKKCNSTEGIKVSKSTFRYCYDRAGPEEQTRLEAMWKQAKLGEF